ncbi:MAG TPA: hypothetical protein VN112_16280 [Ensifer sp.]|nr:hypothetical protein [Ensifer sp.]
MRQRYCRVCGGWHELDQWPHNCLPTQTEARSSLPAPRIVSDNIEIRSMLDGQMYSSKSQLRGTYKAAGVEEVGNEMPKCQPLQKSGPSVKESLHRAISQHS